MDWTRWGTIGSFTFATTGAIVWSTSGEMPLNASLYFSGTTASLTSGLPSRETCTHLPDAAAPEAEYDVVARRSVVLHTPITGFRCGRPLSASRARGTCSAIVSTL